MPNPNDRLAAALADRYRVDGQLGQGGMATVYLAHDLRHNRPVALKVLRPELAAALGPDRFLREITITAQLEHPHIVPLLDSGEAAGFLYYTMPFVAGETLRQRLDREKQLPLDDAVEICGDVADALSYAHSKGVLHRDIKPENILLSGGHARVMDFGIARAVTAAGAATLTETGIVLGTPAYLSPEQVAGDRELDGRSDLYGLGCVVHEMLAGQPPFSAPTMESLALQHLSVLAPPVTQFRPSLPPAIAPAIQRALAKAPADRFDSVARFAEAITRAGTAAESGAPRRNAKSVGRWIAGAAGVTLVAGAIWLLRPSTAATTEAPSVAVLPFRNLGAPDDEYFADGITEEISARLSKISGLIVISRGSARQYKNSPRAVQDIAKELGVRYVLAGTVRTDRRADGTGQVRVAPQLIRVASAADLPMDTYTSGLTPGEIFATQSRIAERVAAALDVTLLSREQQTVRREATVDARAYEAYLLGRYQLNRSTSRGIEEANRYFEQAVARDSLFAPAHAGLADAMAQISFFPDIRLPIAGAFDRAEAAARRAIALDSSLAEAHASLGFILLNGKHDWIGAEQQLRRAIAFDSNYAPAHASLSDLLTLQKRYAEALAAVDRALHLEPTSPTTRFQRGVVLLQLGRYDEAVAEERTAISLQPEYLLPHVWLAQIASLRGDLAGMARELGAAPGTGPGLANVSRAIADLARDPSQRPAAVAAIGSLRSVNEALNAVRQSWLYAAIGATDSALVAFERGVRGGSTPGLRFLRMPAIVKAIGSTPKYRTLMEELGLEP